MLLNPQKYLILPILCLISQVAFGNSDLLKSTINKYKNSPHVEMQVEKIVKSELMGSENKHTGKIYLSSGGLFRWENEKPEKSLLVYDGKTIWNEQTPPPEFPGPVQVARATVNKKNKSQLIVATLLSEGKILDNFIVEKEEKMNDVFKYVVKSKNSDLLVNNLELKIDPKKKQVIELSFKDDVGNLTTMIFSGVQFKKTKNKKLFMYKPPKDAQVSNL
jgi:outer membrane lipoprotein carrier protein